MAERTTVTQVVQIGVETTPGTAVAANKALQSLSIQPSIKSDNNVFRPMGYKFPTVQAQGKEWVEADISGAPCYTELQYVLASLLTYSASVQNGSTTAYDWTLTPSSTAPDAPKTYTVEVGSSVRAGKFAHGLITEATFGFSRDAPTLSGKMIGYALTDGISLTSSPTALALVPILGKETDIFLDTTAGGIGTTKLTRALSAELKIANRYNPLWVINSANPSFVTYVETPVDAQLKLKVEADATGMGLLSRLRDGASSFVRILNTSSQLAGTALPYRLQFDLAMKVTDVSKMEDADGVYAIEWTCDLMHDSGLGNALTAILTNKATAL